MVVVDDYRGTRQHDAGRVDGHLAKISNVNKVAAVLGDGRSALQYKAPGPLTVGHGNWTPRRLFEGRRHEPDSSGIRSLLQQPVL